MSAVGIDHNVTVIGRRRGREIYRYTTRNRVTASGRNVVRDLLAGRGKPPRYIALGTGTASVTDLDTDLGSESFRRQVDRILASGDEVLYDLFVSETEAIGDLGGNPIPVTYYEIGLFSGTAWETGTKDDDETRNPFGGGVLVARARLAPCTKDEETTLSIVWELRVLSKT